MAGVAPQPAAVVPPPPAAAGPPARPVGITVTYILARLDGRLSAESVSLLRERYKAAQLASQGGTGLRPEEQQAITALIRQLTPQATLQEVVAECMYACVTSAHVDTVEHTD